MALIGGKLCPDRSTATDHPSPTTHLHPATMNLYTPPHAQMIQLTGAAKRFGPKTLFENLDWLVTPNERAGIVGANGTGKSTLLKILAGIDGLDGGTIVTMKGASIGYLPQEGLSLSGGTVFAECVTVFADLLAQEQDAPLPNGWGRVAIDREGRGNLFGDTQTSSSL